MHKKLAVRQSENHIAPFRLMIQCGKKQAAAITNHELVIKNKNNEYTDAFIALLKDYYLYL